MSTWDKLTHCLHVCSNPSQVCKRYRGNDSTSSLVHHARKCDPQVQPETNSIEHFASGCGYRREEFHVLILLWVIRRCRPFSIVEDTELQSLFSMLYKKVSIPSQRTISRHINIFHQLCKDKVISTLKSYKGAVHIGLDTWTSGHGIPYMGITIHRCVDGSLQSMILDFIRLTSNHTGDYLAKEVFNCLKSYGLADKFLGLASDNASNNGRLINCLQRLVPTWGGKKRWIRFLGHILS